MKKINRLKDIMPMDPDGNLRSFYTFRDKDRTFIIEFQLMQAIYETIPVSWKCNTKTIILQLGMMLGDRIIVFIWKNSYISK